MNDTTLAPLTVPEGSATDRVFGALYDAVITVKLPPGTKVSEADIAKQLDVSRQPVRDAFFRLSNLGFIAIRPQRPTLITQISPRAIKDAVFVRTALETECLRTAMAQNRQGLIKALANSIADQKATVSKLATVFHALDEAFHEEICTASGHAHVWTLIREQKAHLDRVRFLSLSDGRSEFVIDEHSAILRAVEAGDDAKADTLLRGHIDAVHDMLPSITANHPTYFAQESSGLGA